MSTIWLLWDYFLTMLGLLNDYYWTTILLPNYYYRNTICLLWDTILAWSVLYELWHVFPLSWFIWTCVNTPPAHSALNNALWFTQKEGPDPILFVPGCSSLQVTTQFDLNIGNEPDVSSISGFVKMLWKCTKYHYLTFMKHWHSVSSAVFSLMLLEYQSASNIMFGTHKLCFMIIIDGAFYSNKLLAWTRDFV